MALSFLTGLAQGANRSMERRIARLDAQRLQAANDRRYNEGLARQDAAFAHQQNMDAARLNQWDRTFTRQGDWRDEDITYRRGRDTIADTRYDTQWQHQLGREKIADERYLDERTYARGRDTIGDKFRNWRATQQDAQWQAAHDFEKWYKGKYLEYLDASAMARSGRGGGSSGSSLDSNTVKVVEGLADSYVKTFNDASRHIPFWFDSKINPVEQMEYMETQGANIMNLLMTRFPGDPVTAIQYLPSFWGRVLTAGEKGEYGDKFREKIHRWRENSPGRIEQEMSMDLSPLAIIMPISWQIISMCQGIAFTSRLWGSN